jgi:hypothetical protein
VLTNVSKMDLLLQIKIEAQDALQKIYVEHLNNLILYEDTHQTKLMPGCTKLLLIDDYLTAHHNLLLVKK